MKENDDQQQQQHEDRLRNLHECLLLRILLNLPTKDVVKCSVLSSEWRNVWKLVPGLDLDFDDFRDHVAFASFIDRFLGLNSESRLQHFKFAYEPEEEEDEVDLVRLTRWIGTAVDRKVQHLHVWYTTGRDYELEIPQTVYTCESLVSLNLRGVCLPNPKIVSLPCVKVITLDLVRFTRDWGLVLLISGCPLLKSFTLTDPLFSIASFEDLVVAVDAPRLEYLKIFDYFAQSFMIHSPGSLAEADIGIAFNVLCKNRFDPDNLTMRNMIRSFLMGISSVKVMNIHTYFLEAIYNNSRRQRLPLFPNLTSLRAVVDDCRWEMLPIFLESCPNLKDLSLVYQMYGGEEVINVPGPRCFLPCLESVEIKEESSRRIITEARVIKVIKLATYFLEKSTILKKLILSLRPNNRKKRPYAFLKELLKIPKLSPSCQVVVLRSCQ
ncbi:unnamed protein product [Microthlaspi erraticum]|uniref:FBD domain-containing protein n=1 Tax=Microthlaspi erraticum TaxID=1685480 RepID=A0A6D2JQM2_9BRAS|nr:unnamed protein product [Microthlaspi erraticum]